MAQLLSQVAIELTTARSSFNSIVYQPQEAMPIRHRAARLDYVEVSFLRPLAFDETTPVLALDGTACVTLWRRLLGERLAYLRIRAPRLAFVTQVSEKRFSTRSLIGDRKGSLTGDRANEAVTLRGRILKLLSQQSGQVFLCGCKDVIQELVAIGLPANVMVGHFNAQRGLNIWQACSTAIVLGRLEPLSADIEALARAYTASIDVLFTPAPYQLEPRPIAMRDGTKRHELVPAHPDPTANALLQLIREAEIEQSIERVRPVRQPRRLILLTNVPVEVEVDELVPWPKLHRRALSFGAVFGQHGLLPLRAEHLHGIGQGVWRTPNAAARAAQRSLENTKCDRAQIKALIGNCRFSEAIVLVRYALAGAKGRYSVALVDLDRHPHPAPALTALLLQFGQLETGQEIVVQPTSPTISSS